MNSGDILEEGLLGKAWSSFVNVGEEVWMIFSKRSRSWSTSGVSGLGKEDTELGENDEDRLLLFWNILAAILTCWASVFWWLVAAATSASCSSALEQVDGCDTGCWVNTWLSSSSSVRITFCITSSCSTWGSSSNASTTIASSSSSSSSSTTSSSTFSSLTTIASSSSSSSAAAAAAIIASLSTTATSSSDLFSLLTSFTCSSFSTTTGFSVLGFVAVVTVVLRTGFFSVILLYFRVRPVMIEVGGVFFETPPFVVVVNFVVAVAVDVAVTKLPLLPFNSDLLGASSLVVGLAAGFGVAVLMGGVAVVVVVVLVIVVLVVGVATLVVLLIREVFYFFFFFVNKNNKKVKGECTNLLMES